MHLEIQVALHFLISFLYNKLPRRRVNQFGEELEAALKVKFATHWYPNQPAKGSAYRCLKTTNPLDPVFELAAQNCGLQLTDIQAYLPSELCIWIDPGEVSYRMSEKGQVKLLYQESLASNQTSTVSNNNNNHHHHNALDGMPMAPLMSNGTQDSIHSPYLESALDSFLDNSVVSSLDDFDISTSSPPSAVQLSSNAIDMDGSGRKVRSFNPEAQCFKPDSMSFSNVMSSNSNGVANGLNFNNNSYGFGVNNVSNNATNNGPLPPPPPPLPLSSLPPQAPPSQLQPTAFNNYNFSASTPTVSKSPLLTPGFAANKANQVTMTTAQFAQTKFGSTKLKSSGNGGSNNGSIVCGINGSASKRNYSNRMSPTEFSAYIKQRALLQASGGNNNNGNTTGNGSALITTTNNGINQSRPMNTPSAFGQMSAAVTRSLSANFGNFASSTNSGVVNTSTVTNSATNQMMLSLSPQPSRCISPMSPGNRQSTLDPLSYLMLGNNSSGSALSSHSTSPLGAMFSSSALGNNPLTAGLNSQLCNNNSSSALGNSLHHSGENSLLELNYLSDFLGNTSLSPVLGGSASSNIGQTNKNRSNSFGSRLGHLLMDDQHKDDCAAFSTSLVNSSSHHHNQQHHNQQHHHPFVGFGSAEFANRLSPQPPNNGVGQLNVPMIGGNGLQSNFVNSSGLQLDCNNNNLISSSSGNNHNDHNNDSGLNSSSEMINGNHGGANNSTGNSSAGSSNAGDAQANGNTGEDGSSFDSFSISLNGVSYPNQYQHLLVAN